MKKNSGKRPARDGNRKNEPRPTYTVKRKILRRLLQRFKTSRR